MDRNWLIRTAQNQILGPVSKEKLIEFVNKNVLGPTDEISSGNGYWFSLKEKDLMDRYLFGDVPQSYNPISESKTVLARKASGDKTSSLNVAPPNVKEERRAIDKNKQAIPNPEDLEFPDFSDLSDLKLPKSDDLEFPEIESSTEHTLVLDLKKAPINGVIVESKEDVVLPQSEDLEFPTNELENVDANRPDITSTKIDPSLDLNLDVEYTRTVAIKPEQAKEILNIEKPKSQPVVKNQKGEKKIQLHERKKLADKPAIVDKKSSKGVQSKRDPKREQVYNKLKEDKPIDKKRSDNYLFIILFLILAILGSLFYYFKEILNKPFI